jgi:hypothetical protein
VNRCTRLGGRLDKLAADRKGSVVMLHLPDKFKRFILRVALPVGCFAFGPARAEEAVLLASTVPGYVPGMVVSSTDRLSVPDGASATLLFRSGEMLSLHGPFEGPLGQQQSDAAKGGAAALADAFRMQGIDATVIGGTRSTSIARPEPMLEDVEVDPQRSGTYCVESASTVWITRPDQASGVYALQRKGSSRTLGWPSGAGRIEWPADVPVEDGSQFEITTGGSALATVTFRAIPSAGVAETTVATGFILGCHDQFDTALKKLSRSFTVPELWITTDHGRRPVYHAGDAIALTTVANSDGYLYCFAVSEDGGVTAVFPAGAVDGAQLRGSSPLSIPGRRQPVGLVATPGTRQVRCWLADRDITPELPHALLGSPSVRLPDQLAGDLDTLFARVKGTRIEADLLTIKTE